MECCSWFEIEKKSSFFFETPKGQFFFGFSMEKPLGFSMEKPKKKLTFWGLKK